MIKLVLCDMDLTLVPFQQHTVTQLGMQAIHELLDLGVYVGASSGRGLPDLIDQFCGDERCVRTAVASNGCQVMADGELICHRPLPREELEAALPLVRDAPGAFFSINMNGDRACVGKPQEVVDRRYANWANAHFHVIDSFPDGDLVKVNISFEDSLENAREIVDLIRPLTPSIDYCILDNHVADLMPTGCSKARGAQALLDYFDITADEMLIFGDSENDLSLFEAFPESTVAMANAIPEIRDLARWHIGPCTEDTCAYALLELARSLREGSQPRWMNPEADREVLERVHSDVTISAAYLHELWIKPAQAKRDAH